MYSVSQQSHTAAVGVYQPLEGAAAIPRYYSNAQSNLLRGLAITQVVMGLMSIAFGAVAWVYFRESDFFSTVNGIIGTGMWIGIFIVLTGSIGICSSVSNGPSQIVACMILNILCTLACAAAVIVSGISIGINLYACRLKAYDIVTMIPLTLDCNTFEKPKVIYVMDILVLSIMAIQFVMTIVCSGICCGAVCCRTRTMIAHPPAAVQVTHTTGVAPTASFIAAPVPLPAYPMKQQV